MLMEVYDKLVKCNECLPVAANEVSIPSSIAHRVTMMCLTVVRANLLPATLLSDQPPYPAPLSPQSTQRT